MQTIELAELAIQIRWQAVRPVLSSWAAVSAI